MRRILYRLLGIAVTGSLCAWAYTAYLQHLEDEKSRDLLEFMTNAEASPDPQNGLATDWLDCLDAIGIAGAKEAKEGEKFFCRDWEAQGVTTSMFALILGDEPILVLESRLTRTPPNGPVVVDVVGGPGDAPFPSQPDMTEEFVEETKRMFGDNYNGYAMKESPYYQLYQRGFTIASIGYWGTQYRTLKLKDEFDLGAQDVRLAVDFYRDQVGVEPPMVTSSLGNHLALAGLGEERLSNMNVLSLVPVMDGLQHHLTRHQAEVADKRAEAEEKGLLFGGWKVLNVYKYAQEGAEFDYSRFTPMHEYVPNYIGSADYPFRAIAFERPCSQIVLGDKDPRTTDYLSNNKELPAFVQVWESDHDIFAEKLGQSRALFARFGDCLIEP